MQCFHDAITKLITIIILQMFILSDSFDKVLEYVQHQVVLSDSSSCPIPIKTKVVLDHIEIDPTRKKLMIFCKITQDKWLVTQMVKWKGYTIIAEIGLPGHGVGSYTFRGIGKMPILGKNVSLLTVTDASELVTICFIL